LIVQLYSTLFYAQAYVMKKSFIYAVSVYQRSKVTFRMSTEINLHSLLQLVLQDSRAVAGKPRDAAVNFDT